MKMSVYKKIKKAIFLTLLTMALVGLTACGQDDQTYGLEQLKPPKDGDQIMIVKTSAGEIRIKLLTKSHGELLDSYKKEVVDKNILNGQPFSQVRPNAFAAIYAQELAKEEVPFNDSKASQYYEEHWSYPVEFPDGLPAAYPIRGSVTLIQYMTNKTTGHYTDRLTLLMGEPIEMDIVKGMKDPMDNAFPENVQKAFSELGGILQVNPYTVIGQVYQGMDVCETIMNSIMDDENFVKEDPVILESVSIEPYKVE